MADFFGAIAAGEIGTGRAPLVFPEPTPKNGVVFRLEKTSGSMRREVYKKIDTRAELDFEIEKLKTKYAPFMQKLAPSPKNHRNALELTSFGIREAEPEDLADFSRVLRGEGEWKQITVPYFFGPVGNACTYYRTAFEMKKPDADKAVFLHFDGVDYIAEVFVNGSFAGSHEGFFGAFEFDVTPYIRTKIRLSSPCATTTYTAEIPALLPARRGWRAISCTPPPASATTIRKPAGITARPAPASAKG